MVCSCGFDESMNYNKYPTFAVFGSAVDEYSAEKPQDIPPEVPQEPQKEEPPEVPEDETPTETSQIPESEVQTSLSDVPDDEVKVPGSSGKRPILLYAGAVVLLLTVILTMTMYLRKTPEEPSANLPTMRTMTSDCSRLLSDSGLSGAVLELWVQDQELNERFQVLTVVCAAEVLEDGQEKQYTVELLYQLEDGNWKYSTLSNVREEEEDPL